MSTHVVRVQTDDEGHGVSVDIALVRTYRHGSPACALPEDVRQALLAWLQSAEPVPSDPSVRLSP